MQKQTLSLFLLRLTLGAIFVGHGAVKLFLQRSETTEYFSRLGFPSANLFAVGIGVLELACGTLLIVGLLTRVIAALFAAEMLVAFFTAELPHGFTPGTQLTIVLFVVSLSLTLLGSGNWSLDSYYWKQKRERLEKRDRL